jgi:hypothetical protein
VGLEPLSTREATPGKTSAVSYYTVSNHAYFVGTVALLNSLRLTGNDGDLVVLDAGLTANERTTLARQATVVEMPEDRDHPWLLKPFPHLFGASGLTVMIDSDIIVTGSLAGLAALAEQGRICVYPAWTQEARARWFSEWEQMLGLRAPLRRQEWVHDGVVVFDTAHWPELLERWWEVCGAGRSEELSYDGGGFNGDADALNALLMSELPADALAVLPAGEEVFAGGVTIDDMRSLRCSVGGRPARVIHVPDRPKPWEPLGWFRRGGVVYLRLMRRLLFADDAAVPLRPADVPLLLRPGLVPRLALASLGALATVAVAGARRVPQPLAERLRRLRRKVA